MAAHAACSGQVASGTNEAPSQVDAGAEASADVSGGGDQGAVALEAIEAPMRRMTPLEYRGAVRELFGGAIEPGFFDDANPKAALSGYSTEAAANVSTERGVEQLLIAAEDVAFAASDRLDEIAACAGEPDPGRACFEGLIEDLGARAFRRPLEAEERALFGSIYDEAVASGASFREAVEPALVVMLQMPQFIYVVELGGQEAPGEGAIALTDHEIAQRLALLLLDSIPDKELRRAAEAGELGDPDAIEAQARRLLEGGSGASIKRRLVREWLHLDEALVKDEAVLAGYAPELADSARIELERAFGEALAKGSTLDEFLLLESAPIDQALAEFYGVEGFEGDGADGWERVELPERYRGLIARPYFLASHASQTASSHVQRGYTVLKQLLCSPTGPIPPGALSQIPVYPSGSTSRQKSDQLRETNQVCASCHNTIDPIGLALENYDAIGAWRDLTPPDQSSRPIDASGLIEAEGPASQVDVAGRPFEGARGLTDLLVESESVEACVARQWFRYAAGRRERGEADERVIAQMTESLTSSGGALSELIIGYVRSEAFGSRWIPAAP